MASWVIEYIQYLADQSMQQPWHELKSWSPIKLDALGLITLLGAEEVNQTIGTLQRRRYTEFLPLLAAFVIAGDRFRCEQPGYSLYNLTDGIHTTELKGWFSRWLNAQKIQNATTVFRWQVDGPRPKHFSHKVQLIAPLISFLAVAPLLAFTITMGDWYGMAGTISIIVTVVVRKVMLWQARNGLNKVAAPEKEPKDLPFSRPMDEKEKSRRVDSYARELHRETSQPMPDSVVTCLITRADGRMVTMYAPRTVLSTFVRDIELPYPALYKSMRLIGWASFGVLMVTLGMSSLFTQIYTVALLIISTYAICHDFAFDTGRLRMSHHNHDGTKDAVIHMPLTSRLSVTQLNPAAKHPITGEPMDKRMWAYVRVEPSEKQEMMLKHWSMLPFDGVPWYASYEKAKEEWRQKRAQQLAKDEALRQAGAVPTIKGREAKSSIGSGGSGSGKSSISTTPVSPLSPT